MEEEGESVKINYCIQASRGKRFYFYNKGVVIYVKIKGNMFFCGFTYV